MIKKSILGMGIVSIALLSNINPIFANTIGVVNTSSLNVRSGTGVSYETLFKLKKNTNITLLDTTQKWYQISYNGKVGWVNGSYVNIKSNSNDSDNTTSSNEITKIATTNVNMRAGASTNYKILITISKGKTVKVLSSSNRWDKVSYDGRIGYVSNQYLKLVTTSPDNNTSKYTPKDSMSASAHEGIPNGAPVDWKYKPRIENQNKPINWNAIGQWGQIYLEEGFDYPENTAIEIANFKMYGYSEELKEWKLINHSIPGDVFYVEDYNGDTNKLFSDKIKKNYENKSLIVKLDKDTKGFNLHPFSQQIDTKSIGLPDVKYVISQMDVRLVKWDENRVDDMDKARYVANVGGDWWRNVGDTWQPDWSTNVGIGQGQFRTVTKEWKSCYMTTVPLDKYDEIVK